MSKSSIQYQLGCTFLFCFETYMYPDDYDENVCQNRRHNSFHNRCVIKNSHEETTKGLKESLRSGWEIRNCTYTTVTDFQY